MPYHTFYWERTAYRAQETTPTSVRIAVLFNSLTNTIEMDGAEEETSPGVWEAAADDLFFWAESEVQAHKVALAWRCKTHAASGIRFLKL